MGTVSLVAGTGGLIATSFYGHGRAPEGLDFCDVHAGSAITKDCERLFEVIGEAVDLLLVHPLMLHSASPNPSPRIRLLGNPMVYLQAPLDHRRADASLVELVIARALAGPEE